MKKQLLMIGLMAVGTFGLISCNNDENDEMPKASVTVKARTIANDSQPDENARLISGANIISAEASIANLSIQGGSESSDSTQVPIKQGSSFTLGLVQSALPLSKTLETVTLDQGTYSKISLQFQSDDSLMDGDAMFEKTLQIHGNVNEQLLTIYTDNEEILSAMAEGGSLNIEGNQELYLNFDLNRLLENVDLTLAVDGNSNGTIEIEPNNLDGNRDIYLTIIGNLENALSISTD
ncbi:hypothetical protein IFO69_13850 [Echinicola sp. CAU 1574]|uniref:DUF4382 domain-containing protein n=1 Tax=Echinicola arenosa TaxID=2774144 RepID=A0ABR9AM13_9BACT|nr:hypothetical protein [Echinicola arenosa]MBD8489837.1 hypothetical protein [Echinicola arenosa]